MSNTSQYIIDFNGRVFREDITRRELNCNGELEAAFAKSARMRARNVFMTQDKLPVHGCFGPGFVALSTHLPRLPIRCSWRASQSEPGIVQPDFKAADNIMELIWNPLQEEVIDVLFIETATQKTADGGQVWTHYKAYLYAIDPNTRQSYRLPLANIFDSGELCTGFDHLPVEADLASLHHKVLTQVYNSAWRTDLLPNQTMSAGLFRFKLTGKGYTQLPPAGPWTSFCQPAANSVLADSL